MLQGWDVGVEGMRVGDKRKLVIPPQMGYGSQRTGPIPPNSVLEFDVSGQRQQQQLKRGS
jgi:FK506-binding nuclear protein